jgi:hypothetical protein
MEQPCGGGIERAGGREAVREVGDDADDLEPRAGLGINLCGRVTDLLADRVRDAADPVRERRVDYDRCGALAGVRRDERATCE